VVNTKEKLREGQEQDDLVSPMFSPE